MRNQVRLRLLLPVLPVRRTPPPPLPRGLLLTNEPLRKHHLPQRRSYMDVHQRPSHSRMFNREPVNAPPPTPTTPESVDSESAFYGILCFRAAVAVGFVYCLTEYVADITLTEGPSMTPTIQSSGEIIMVDKVTLNWNSSSSTTGRGRLELAADKRVEQAMQRQKEFEEQNNLSSNSSNKNMHHVWHEPCISVTDLPRPTWRQWWTVATSPLAVGDVVVVQHPHRRGTVCKRVLGLPGDQILLYRAQRSQPNQHHHLDQSNVLIVPDGHVWLEGDNPNNSADSRSYGPVPAALIQGRVLARIWPLRGQAVMVRGARPRQEVSLLKDRNVSSSRRQGGREPCTGSTVLPAGYQGQQIVKHYAQQPQQ
jgi:inner membrane protease subunit 1